MLVTHNAMEILFTPGRVTMLGESDGNRLRQIYTDGRGHPDDEELTFHGHSIGRWEGDTLVVETVNVLPQAYIAVSEAAGVANDGDMKIMERIHLAGPGHSARRSRDLRSQGFDRTVEHDAHFLPAAREKIRHRGRRLPARQLFRTRQRGRQPRLR